MVKVKKHVAKKQPQGQKIKSEKSKYCKPHAIVSKAEEKDTIDYDSKIDNRTSDDGDTDDMATPGIGVAVPKHNGEEDKNIRSKTTTKRKLDTVATPTSKPATNAPVSATKKQKNAEKVKPPTLDEINELKETRNLFHSNLFRLQVKEMLTEVQIKNKYKNYINTWLEQLKSFLNSLESEKETCDSDKLKWLKMSALHVPLHLKELGVQNQKYFQFQFIKPTIEPYLIGAAATQTLLGAKLWADICLPMPAESFQKDNYLNLVYDQKRALYLTYIANQLLASKKMEGLNVTNLKFNYFENNPLKPVLEITPPSSAGSIANRLSFRLFVGAEEKSFKLNRFVPWNSNIRASIFGNDDNDADSVPLATPNYNAGLLFDLTMDRNQRLLHEIFEPNKNIQEGLVLLKVWLQQRQLNVGFSGFHSYLLCTFIAYLFKQRKIHTNMSSYQVARTVWNQLAHSTWDEIGISLCPKDNVVPNQPTLEQFHTYYQVVFIDVSGYHNICANLSLETYRRVRAESKLAVNILNDMKLNSFQLLFMTKCPIYTQFDHILKINKNDAVEQILEMHVPPADKLNYVGYAYPQLLRVVTTLLLKGLGQRVQTLLPIEQRTKSWSPIEQAPGCSKNLHLGIVLNSEHAYEVLDKGPESIVEEAEEFRKFWGDKAKLRRFQDGSITESVVWAATTDSLMKKRLVVRSIVLHLLQHHFQLDIQDIDYIAGEFDVVYQLTPAFKTDKLSEKYKVPQDTDAESRSLDVIRSFDDLARKLHALHELPLEIASIAGISPVFRYCDPTPILPQSRCINQELYAMSVQHGVIQLGHSGKWPNELPALRALKTAFYLQISKLLSGKHHLLTKCTYDGVLVLKQGYCFAIEIAHPKEVGLLKKEKTERGITQYVDCDASIALEKRHYILPRVTGALHALHQLHPSYGATVMMAKRWLYSQLIDDGLWPDECTELLIASQYVKTNAQHITCSPQTGFIRFLQLLAYTNWKTELFLVNFNNTMGDNEVSELEHRFNEERDTFPPLCIVTAYDQKHYGSIWTSNQKPNVHVVARVTILARQALAIIEPALLSSESFIKPSKLFTASSEGYDLVIQLKPDMIPNCLALEYGSPFSGFAKPNWRLPLADTNFIRDAVEKLREAYTDFAVFFYNPCGGKEIGVIWRPQIFTEKEFKVNDVNGCGISPDGTKLLCKKDILIEDFKFILKDFYLRIDTVEAVKSAARESAQQQRSVRYFDKSETGIGKKVKAYIKSAKPKPSWKKNIMKKHTAHDFTLKKRKAK